MKLCKRHVITVKINRYTCNDVPLNEIIMLHFVLLQDRSASCKRKKKKKKEMLGGITTYDVFNKIGNGDVFTIKILFDKEIESFQNLFDNEVGFSSNTMGGNSLGYNSQI